MSIAKRVKEAVYRLTEGDWEAALIPASIAVDATAKREHPGANNNDRYKRFLDENQELVLLVGTKGAIWWRGEFSLDCYIGGRHCSSISDVLYNVVRCGLLHEAELPAGVNFTQELPLRISLGGGFSAPALLIHGLIVAVVASPANRHETFHDNLGFFCYGQTLRLNDFRGQKDKIMSVLYRGMQVRMARFLPPA